MSIAHNILVPLDGSVNSMQAIGYACMLAHQQDHLILYQAVPEHYEDPSLDVEFDIGWSETSAFATAASVRANLQMYASSIPSMGKSLAMPRVIVEFGDPSEGILSAVARLSINLIVMTTRGQGGLKRALFGSVTERIVRQSAVPVCVIHPQVRTPGVPAAGVRRIVVPLDGSSLAENALPVAAELAHQDDTPLLLVCALLIYPLTPWSSSTAQISEGSTDDAYQSAMEYLDAIRARLVKQGLTVATVVGWGTPFKVITGYALPEDLIVLTSHGRSGIKRWLLGSVADELIRSSTAPVLLVPVRAIDHEPVVPPAAHRADSR